MTLLVSPQDHAKRWTESSANRVSVAPPAEEPTSVFRRFTGAVLGITKDIAIGTVQAGVKLGLSVGEMPRQVFRNPTKTLEPADFKVSVFGKDISSVQRSTFERNAALQSGQINMKQYIGKAAVDLLDTAQFLPGVGGVAKTGQILTGGVRKVAKHAAEGAVIGAGYGAGYGGAQAMEQDVPWRQVGEAAVEGAKYGAGAGAVVGGGASALSSFVAKRRGSVEPVKPWEKPAETKEAPKGTMKDIQVGKDQKINLREVRENQNRIKVEDVVQKKTADVPRETNVREIIKKDHTISFREVDDIKTPEGKDANGRSKYDIQSRRGTIEVKKGAKDSTVAHEYAHVVNNRLGDGDKVSNQIAAIANGGRSDVPKAVRAYLKKSGVTVEKDVRAEIAKMNAEMKRAARVDKNAEFRLTSPSEEFATAFSNVLMRGEETRRVAPGFSAFIKDHIAQIMPEKVEVKISPKNDSLLKDFGASVERKGGTFKVTGNRAEATVPGKPKIIFNIDPKAKGKDLNQLIGELKEKMKPREAKPKEEAPKKAVESKKEPAKVESKPKEKKSIEEQAREFVAKKKNKFREYNRAEHDAVRDHAALLGKRLTAERGKDKPNKNIIKRLEKAIDSAEREMLNIRTGKKYRRSEVIQNNLTTKILSDIGSRETVSKQYILDAANRPDIKKPERELIQSILVGEGEKISVKDFVAKVKTELLPLEKVDAAREQMGGRAGGYRYEGIVLPQEDRGPVYSYKENIYNSPISNSAGEVHFSSNKPSTREGYFAHTRTEDLPKEMSEEKLASEIAKRGRIAMSGGETRRVIEVQSDLFQKGRLDGEQFSEFDATHKEAVEAFKKGYEVRTVEFDPMEGERIMGQKINSLEELETLPSDNYLVQNPKRANELKKLEPYRNTWHERIIREEVQRAAVDGKTKLQFPTGKTAMKIEGLGEQNNFALTWFDQRPPDGIMNTPGGIDPYKLTEENIVVGKEIQRGDMRKWVITEILGDGKFKAVPKSVFEDKDKFVDWRGGYEETFDISGKIDTENPIYKFYEKTVQKYLKNRYGAKLVTDKQGVTWVEVDVKPEYAANPVDAFRLADDFEAATGIKITDKQEAEIIVLNKKIFGDENVKITAQILTPEGQNALGVYQDSMIKILDGQVNPKESYYHEAVHKYLDTFLTADEHASLLTDYAKQKGIDDILEAEEMIAESFIKYAKSREGVTGSVRVMFDRLIERVKAVFGNSDQVKALYADILAGKKKKPSIGVIEPKKDSQNMVRPADKTKTIAKMDTYDGVKEMARQISESDKIRRDIQSRGVVSWEQTEAEARELGVDFKDIRAIAKRAQDAAAQVQAIRQIRVNVQQELYDFMQGLPEDINLLSEKEKNELVRKIDEATFVDRSLRSINTEYGRAIGINRKAVTPEEYEMNLQIASKLRKIDPSRMSPFDVAKEQAKAMKPESLYRLAVKALVSARTAWMLYSPITHIANVTGIVWKAVERPTTRLIAEGISRGKAGGVQKGESIAYVRGMASVAKEAGAELIKDLKDIVKYGSNESLDTNPAANAKTREAAKTGDLERFLKRAGGDKISDSTANAIERRVTMSYKLLAAADKFGTTIFGAGEFNALQVRKAKDLTYKATEQEMLEQALKEARTALFQETNKVTEGINKMREALPETKIIVPFVNTPVNVAMEGVRTTPLGFARPVFAKLRGAEMNQADKAMAYAQAVLGSAIVGAIWKLSEDDMITTAAPYNSQGREEFFLSKQDYSFKIGDTYISYRRVEPLASIIANVVNLKKVSKSDAEFSEKLTASVALTAKNVLDQTFVKGVSDFFEAMGDVKIVGDQIIAGPAAERYAKSLAVSFIPYGSAFRTVANAMDPTMRETKTLKESAQNIVPGMRNKLPAKIDPFGKEVQSEQGWFARLVSPFKTKTAASDKVVSELEKSEFNVSTFRADEANGIKIEGKTREIWLKMMGKRMAKELESVVTEPGYDGLEQAEKDDVLQKAVTRIRTEMRKEATEDMSDELEKRDGLSKSGKKKYNESMKGTLADSIERMARREGFK